MGLRKHILIVEDESDLAELLELNLRKAGYETAVVHKGRQALDAVSTRPPDLILLDLMLPELSGTEIAGRVRSNPKTASIPIIMLTAKGEEVDQIVGLAVGADDYIPKPFSMKVLLARIEAVLRRAGKSDPEQSTLRLGQIEMNLETYNVTSEGKPVKLTATEFRLLSALIQAGGRILSRASLISRAMGQGVTVTDRTIDVHITAIRKKLGGQGLLIRTVRSMGYRASETEDEGVIG